MQTSGAAHIIQLGSLVQSAEIGGIYIIEIFHNTWWALQMSFRGTEFPWVKCYYPYCRKCCVTIRLRLRMARRHLISHKNCAAHTYMHACMHAYIHTCIHANVHICWRGYRQFRQWSQRQIKIFNAAISYRLCLNLSVFWQNYLISLSFICRRPMPHR